MAWIAGAAFLLYGYAALVALLNLLLMRRPKASDGGPSFCILIPARNEAENLARLLPALRAQSLKSPETGADQPLQILVFDDESEDGTGSLAASLGATVIRPREPLPAGWTGKNRACHELAKAASEASSAEWYVFLDADVYPEPDFAARFQSLLAEVGARTPVVTGFPYGIPGRGVEPVYLSWVSWILLASNPFGLVSKTGRGHNRFTNGQITAWKARTYAEIWPNETLKDKILEDVLIGRLLAKRGIRVEVANLTSALGVKMYDTFAQALDGMSKNSYQITGSTVGTLVMALLLAFLGVGWLLAGSLWWLALGLLLFSKLVTDLLMKGPLWVWPLAPVTCLLGSVTFLRSLAWHKQGKVKWKGRTYPG
jgi:glycosyltransferase involved in cell wall biosynthesis